tara:strand:- start:139 stop:351 length:213 start_codon:yes stop_codon:yes gene_type:complete
MMGNGFEDIDEIIVCPKCKTNISTITSDYMICNPCKLKYSILNGIPILLEESAEPNVDDDIDITNRNWNE